MDIATQLDKAEQLWVFARACTATMAPRPMPEIPGMPAGEPLPGGGWISGPCRPARP